MQNFQNSKNLARNIQLEAILNSTFKEIEDIIDVHAMTNMQMKRLIKKIEVDKEGNVDIYLRLIGDLWLDEDVLIDQEESITESAAETIPNCINRTYGKYRCQRSVIQFKQDHSTQLQKTTLQI